MTATTPNVSASVRARLLNVAKAQGVDFNQVLVRFALERILYRLTQSPHADRFLLKGALLFTLWYDMPTGLHVMPTCWASAPVIWHRLPGHFKKSLPYRSKMASCSTLPPSRSRKSARKPATEAFAWSLRPIWRGRAARSTSTSASETQSRRRLSIRSIRYCWRTCRHHDCGPTQRTPSSRKSFTPLPYKAAVPPLAKMKK